MTKYLFSFGLLFVMICASVCAQTPTLEVAAPGMGSNGSIRFTDPSTIGRRPATDVTYDEVRGRYMWDNDWHAGFLILKGGNKYALDKIKLNLHTQEVHYIGKDGVELVADGALVKKVTLFDGDTAHVLATFYALKAGNAKSNELYQIMNPGKTQLLKKVVSHIKKLPYDPGVGKTEYRFISETEYFVSVEQLVKPLAALSKSAVGSVINIDAQAEEWLGAHKNKLKSEEDVVNFFEYCNAL